MAHQAELEKTKYRNWVRGGLAYKYLKQGIECFADDVVLQEHTRILQNIKHTPGQTCNQCKVGSFKPKHACTGIGTCPRGLNNCSCLNRKKKPCPNKVCDAIMEEILDSHDSHCSKPPTPYWNNRNIHKWCTDPWEVAKCFIHSPGYFNKSNASDIDAAGLLHVFINNINLHSHLSCAIRGNGNDVFGKTLKRRNTIFHSSKMELEDNELTECIDDIITILEDEKELKQKHDAQQAVEKLYQLKQKSFIITTNNEAEVCRDAMVSITNRSDEIKQMIQDAKDDIDKKKTEVFEAVDDKTREALKVTVKQLEKQNDSQLQALKQTIQLLGERLTHVETDNSAMKEDISLIQQRLSDIESSVKELETTRKIHKERLQYVTQKQELKIRLVEYYEKEDYLKTWVSPLKPQDNNVGVDEVYVSPRMVIERKTERTVTRDNCTESRTSTGDTGQAPNAESALETVSGYRDILQTDKIMHNKIYIIGDVGTGKSMLSKMMLYNWCKAVSKNNTDIDSTSDTYTESKASDHDPIQADNVREMSKFDFLFTIPLQRVSGFSSDIKKMISVLYKDVTTNELLTEIFNQESESCLIIADGLDEWTPPKDQPSPLHVSYGIPISDGIKNATVVTLSRPSAKGILNMKLTEYDLKIKLLGVQRIQVDDFIRKYMMKLNRNADRHAFRHKLRNGNLEHLEKTPLVLQQLIWMYCAENDIGKSVSDVYSNIVNMMIGWSEKERKDDTTQPFLNIDKELEKNYPIFFEDFRDVEQEQEFFFL